MNQSERRLYLIRSLLDENPETRGWGIPGCAADQKRLLRGLLNVRPARSANPEFLKIQVEYLRQAIAEKGVTDINRLSPIQPGLYLWQGDITTLKCDAIVNAANSGMTGCYAPNHDCIDNAIHTISALSPWARPNSARFCRWRAALQISCWTGCSWLFFIGT